MRLTLSERDVVPWSTAGDALLLTPKLVGARWPKFLLTGFVAGVLGTAGTFLVHSRFTAVAAFVPMTSSPLRLPSGLSGLAAQFGVNASSGSGLEPSIFKDLLGTVNVRTQVALATYDLPDCVGAKMPRGNLLDAFNVADKPRAKGLDAAIRTLAKTTAIKYDPVAQLVTIQSQSCSPDLAAAILTQYLSVTQRFSLETVRSQAKAARESAERRIAELATDLTAAEDVLTGFYVKNRTFQQSPALQQEETRLRRQVSILESTYLTVRAEYERARLDEAREQPAITVIEPPVPPARKSWPVRWLVGLIAAIIACAVSLGLQLAPLRQSP